MFYSSTGLPALAHSEVNYDVVLGNCNRKLSQWTEQWKGHMQRGQLQPSVQQFFSKRIFIAHGESFHESFLSLFSLYVRLFLNSFGIQAAMQPVHLPSMVC